MNREQYEKTWCAVRTGQGGFEPHFRQALSLRDHPEEDPIWNFRRKAALLHREEYTFATDGEGYYLVIGNTRYYGFNPDGSPYFYYSYDYQRLDQCRDNGRPIYVFGSLMPIKTVPFQYRVEAMAILHNDMRNEAHWDIDDARTHWWRMRKYAMIAERSILGMQIEDALNDA